jgi:dienelactone hydrolase
MMRRAGAIFLACFWWGTAARAEDISVSVDYHGEQIQLAGRFEKPAVGGPLPVVILLHNCAGIDGSPSLAMWAPLMWAQGYATLRLDSFTAPGYHNVCADPWRERLATRHGKLVASVALYGGCRPNTGYPVTVPLLALLGARYDWTPATPCVALASVQANGIMQAQVYPDAYHSFDAASGIEKPHRAYGHLLAYNPAATADAHKRACEFLYRYLR